MQQRLWWDEGRTHDTRSKVRSDEETNQAIAFVWALTGHIQGVASPFVGTIIDFTRYRRCTGWVMSMLCAVSLVLSGFVFENNEAAFVLQLANVCLAFTFYEGMYLVRISYLPEMSPDIDVVSQVSWWFYLPLHFVRIRLTI